MLSAQSKGKEKNASQLSSRHELKSWLQLKRNAPRKESSRLLNVRLGQLLDLSNTELTSKSSPRTKPLKRKTNPR